MTKVVLVVDDSLTIRQELATLLKPEGYEIREAGDGQEALRRIDEGPLALILCDVNMPRMGGLELLDVLKERGNTVPVLMLTTEGEPDAIERARNAGAKGWIIKPFNAQTLISAINRIASG